MRFLSVEPLLEDLGKFDLHGINWVIVGGESGPGARPMKKEWVVSVRDQCKRARVPFFSSSGVAFGRRQRGASWTEKRTTNFLIESLIQSWMYTNVLRWLKSLRPTSRELTC